MPDPRDTIELSNSPGSASQGPGCREGGASGRGYLRLWFSCAGQYARAYKNAAGTAYMGRCPTCGRSVRFGIGPDGTSKRFFEVRC